MHKAHCDLCDALVEGYRHWVDIRGDGDTVHPDGTRSHIVHLRTEANPGERERDYCLSCWKKILAEMLLVLNADEHPHDRTPR